MYHADRSEEKRYSQAEGDVERESEPSLRETPPSAATSHDHRASEASR